LTEIILVRHGQTAWNKEPRFRGQVDIPLDETGIIQAKATADRISQWSVSAVYSSPLKRARSTAQVIAEKQGIEVELHNGLLDIDFGRWQGLTPEEVAMQDGDLLDTWLKEPHKVIFPEGESLNEVRDRFTSALNELVSKHDNETIVVVSHVVALKVILCAILGLDDSHFWQIAQYNCAISIVYIKKDSNFIVSLINDICHLK
jgi:broad specificity phosphatase PhoE